MDMANQLLHALAQKYDSLTSTCILKAKMRNMALPNIKIWDMKFSRTSIYSKGKENLIWVNTSHPTTFRHRKKLI